MIISYYNIVKNKKAENELDAHYHSVEKVCQDSDFVVMGLPHTKETEKFFNKKKLDFMKPSAFFINCTRGPIFDEEALYQTLKDNRIAGAAIDVFAQDPPTKDNPLFQLDNIVITAHSATNTKSAMVGMAMVVENVLRVLEGEEPKYPANNPKRK